MSPGRAGEAHGDEIRHPARRGTDTYQGQLSRFRQADITLFDEDALDDVETGVDRWLAGIEDRATKARALAQRMAEMSVSAASSDRLVTVTVSSSGVLRDLRLADGVRRHSGEWIASQILSTMRTAIARLADQADQAVDDTVGRDSPEGRAILASLHARTAGEI